MSTGSASPAAPPATDLGAARRALLAERVRAASARPSAEAAAARIPRRTGGGPAPLSACQRQLWYLHQLAPTSTAYNELVTLRHTGVLDVDALRWALTEFVRRHEAWRTTFVVLDGEPRQVVTEPGEVALPVVDLSGLPLADAEAEATRLAAASTRQPYDLSAGPPLRLHLVRLSDDEHRLYLGLHHIVFDGVTLGRVMLPEVVALYGARVAGQGSPLAEPAVQYPDFAVWEVEQVRGPQVARHLAWWREALAGLPPLDLPLDHPRPAGQRFTGGMVPLSVDAATVESLRGVARRSGASLFQALAAVHAWWLGRYSGQDDVAFGTAVDLRTRPELTAMAGYCLAQLPVRVDLSAAPTARQLVERVRGSVVDAMEHAVPSETLVRALAGPRSAGLNPLVATALVLEPPVLTPDPAWSLHSMEVAVGQAVGGAKFDLSVDLDERPDGHLDGRLVYDRALFDPDTAAAMAAVWTRLVTAAAAAPDVALDTLDLLEPAAAPVEAAPEPQERAGRCVHDVIRAQAARTPGAVAVVCGDRQLTYEQLQAGADAVAARLRRAGAGPGAVVATVLDRSVDLVVGVLGVLTAGAAYLPLAPTDPVARHRALAQDAGAGLVLTSAARAPQVAELGRRIVTVDGPDPLGHPASGLDDATGADAAGPEDLAYVIFTSGSTGRPKGVLVEHRSATHLMAVFLQRVGVGAGDTYVSVASPTFDMFVADLFCTLGVGARLVIATDEQVRDPRLLAALLESASATAAFATPTAWAGLVRSGWAGRGGFVALTGGEALSEALARDLADRCAAVWNAYGPTEVTVMASVGRVVPGTTVTVGRPLPGVRVEVHDARGPVPVGVPGEVLVGGPGLARGYADLPAETAALFVPDPRRPGQRLYRTGDRGRLLPDGTLAHLGRFDDQVKVRGFRIEPGEVEAALTSHPEVSEAAVVARGEAGGRQLVAYVVGLTAATSDVALRSWLRARLPEHMVPTVLVRLADLPRSGAGKVDRRALPDPASLDPASLDPALLDPALAAGAAAPGRRPGSPLQEQLAQLWSTRLRAPVTDVDADFFDLGGYSLLAADVVAALEQEVGVSVSLADFLDTGTTVAGLAALVESRRTGRDAGAGATAVRPLFIAYPDLATAVGMRHLMAQWGQEQPVVPLAPQPMRTRFDRRLGLEGLTARMLTRIRSEQPHGPYALAGFSVGGMLVYDAARRLQEEGEQVEWLGVFDTGTPAVADHLVRHDLQTWVANQRARSRRDQVAEVAMLARRYAHAGLAAAHLAPAPVPQFDFRGAREIVRSYPRRGHDIPVQLVTSTESIAETGQHDLGWHAYHRGPLRIHHFPGDHAAMLRPPHVDALAELVLTGLHQARAATADA